MNVNYYKEDVFKYKIYKRLMIKANTDKRQIESKILIN